ncbi:hypothetical protein ScPMuIL_003604 [Solemya velum]
MKYNPRKERKKMTIVYSCIARGKVILCSHQIGSGSFEHVVESMLRNVATQNDGKITYTSDSYMFHCIIENGMIYMCAAKQEFGKQQPYAYLAEIKKSYQNSTLAMRSYNAREHEFDSEFSSAMTSGMEKYSRGDGGSKVALLRSQVDEVKDVMTQNIEKVLERGDHLDILVDKTEDLQASAATFQKTSRKIRQKFWWKNTKMMCILALVIFIVLTVIIVLICYGAGVFKSDSSSSKTTPAPIKSTPHT